MVTERRGDSGAIGKDIDFNVNLCWRFTASSGLVSFSANLCAEVGRDLAESGRDAK